MPCASAAPARGRSRTDIFSEAGFADVVGHACDGILHHILHAGRHERHGARIQRATGRLQWTHASSTALIPAVGVRHGSTVRHLLRLRGEALLSLRRRIEALILALWCRCPSHALLLLSIGMMRLLLIRERRRE